MSLKINMLILYLIFQMILFTSIFFVLVVCSHVSVYIFNFVYTKRCTCCMNLPIRQKDRISSCETFPNNSNKIKFFHKVANLQRFESKCMFAIHKTSFGRQINAWCCFQKSNLRSFLSLYVCFETFLEKGNPHTTIRAITLLKNLNFILECSKKI